MFIKSVRAASIGQCKVSQVLLILHYVLVSFILLLSDHTQTLYLLSAQQKENRGKTHLYCLGGRIVIRV